MDKENMTVKYIKMYIGSEKMYEVQIESDCSMKYKGN